MWTFDEGDIEFYGSEITMLTEAWPRSLFPKVHKPILPDIIGQYLLYYMSNVYVKAQWFIDTYHD